MMMVMLMVIAPPVGLHVFCSYHGIEAGVVLWVKICDINNVVSVSITYRLHKKTKDDTDKLRSGFLDVLKANYDLCSGTETTCDELTPENTLYI